MNKWRKRTALHTGKGGATERACALLLQDATNFMDELGKFIGAKFDYPTEKGGEG